MAKKRKGRPIHGWLIVNKPTGLTSTAVVNKARWALGAQKAGHAGTLDPAATGLLAIAFGEATKTINVVMDDLKAYRFGVRFGSATNTDDAEGEVIATSGLRPSKDQIEAEIPQFVGDIMQVPPKFSAVKVDGARAYALARDGEDLELAARPLFVESLELISIDSDDHATLEMVCGKGGYVRAIARDLGNALGCHAHVSSLRRMWGGPFDLENAVEWAQLEECGPASDDLLQHILPLEAGLTELPEQPIGPEGAAALRNGNPGAVAATNLSYGDPCWVSHQGRAIALATYRAGNVAPTRVFVFPPA